MTELAEILGAISAAQTLIAWATQQAQLGSQAGKFTPEQMAQIKVAAGVSDENWDAAVAAAKARIGA